MKYVGIRKENNLYKILESNDFQDIKGFELLHSRGEIRSYDYEIEDVLFAVRRKASTIEYIVGNEKDIAAIAKQDPEYCVRSKGTLWNPVLRIELEILSDH